MDEIQKEEGRLLANKAFLLAISKIIATIFNILLFIILSYNFTEVEYGSFRQVWLINRALAWEIFTLGIPLSIFYFLPRLEDNQIRGFVLQAVIALAVIGIIVTAGVFLFAGVIAQWFNNPDLESLLRIFCLFPLLMLPTLVTEGVLISLNRTRTFAFFSILERLCMFVAAVLAIVLFQSIEMTLGAIIVFAVIRFLVCLYLVQQCLKGLERGGPMFNVFKLLKFSLPIGVSGIVDILNVELDKIIIALFFTVTQFAIFTNGAFEIPMIAAVAGAVNSIMMSEFSKGYKEGRLEDVVRLWKSSIIRVGLIFVPLMGFLFFFATDFITLVFSDKYTSSAIIFQIYIIAMIPRIVWFSPILVSLGHFKEPLIGSSIALTSNVILNLLFIQWIGFVGPAIATVLATFIITAYFLNRLKSALQLHLRDIFPWKEIGLIILISAGVGWIVFAGLSLLHAPNYIRLAVGGVIFYVIAYPLLWRLGLLGRTEVDYLLNYSRKVSRIISRR